MDRPAADSDLARIHRLETSDAPQERRLATAGRAEQTQVGSVRYHEIYSAQRLNRPEALADPAELDFSHRRPPPDYEGAISRPIRTGTALPSHGQEQRSVQPQT